MRYFGCIEGGLDVKTVNAVWYAEVNATTGTVSPPAGGTLVADRFSSGTDALCSTITTLSPPDDEPAKETDGTPVLVSSFDVGSGAFTLSGTPSNYPVAVIFAYTIDLIDFDSTKTIFPVFVEDNSEFLVSPVGGVSRDTKLQANLTDTTISFADMFDNPGPNDDYNVALWTFGTVTIAAGGITLFAAPGANIERMGVIKIDFTNVAAFDPLAWPIDTNGKRPEFTASAIYGWVFVTKNDHGLFYTWREEVA